MNKAMFAAVILFGCAGAATPALAGSSLAEAYYVKTDGTGQTMLADRAACVTDAQQFGVDRASDFSNPEYGSLTALGAALDENALHGSAKQAVRRAVRDACMQKHGWTRLDPSEEDAKTLKKASLRHTEALDAWLVANAPKPPVVISPPPPAQAAAVSTPSAATPAIQSKISDPAVPKP